MRNYKMNVNEYLSEETLGEITVGIGDDFGYMPFEEAEANFAFIESIKDENDFYIITITRFESLCDITPDDFFVVERRASACDGMA